MMNDDAGINTISDIARLAGVSKSTVSRALNDSPLIGVETKRRIAAIAQEHDFRISTAARSLSLRSSKTVGFVIDAWDEECMLENPFGLELMGAVARGLRELGYEMLVIQPKPNRDDWISEYLKSGRVAGFILMTSDEKSRQVRRLVELGAPFSIWGRCEGFLCCSVISDNAKGGGLAATRFRSQGRRKPAFLGGPTCDCEIVERRRGFVDGLAPLVPVAEAVGDYSEASGIQGMRRILSAVPDVDAVFVAGDLMAIGAMRALAESGRRVPDDVAVIGYDDLFVSAYSTPRLTTVSQHIADSGRLLAGNLVASIERGIVSGAVVPVELVVRESG